MTGSLRAVVTGGGGFLGSRIVSMLSDAGHEVVSFSRNSHPALVNSGVNCRVGDLTDAEAVCEAFRDAGVVYHVAARAELWGDCAVHHAVNVAGTRNVIEACRRNRIRRLVYTSTPSVVFGGSDLRNVCEDVPYPKKYLSHYAKTKAEAERLVLEANGPDLATVALRPHVIWGPGDTRFFPQIVGRRRANRLIMVGNGTSLVDTTFVDNAAQAHLDAAERLEPGCKIGGRAFFISQGDPRPIRSFVNSLLKVGGLPPVTKSLPLPAAYAAGWFLEHAYRLAGIDRMPPATRYLVLLLGRDHYFDISAARRDLGYNPSIDIEEGMRLYRSALLNA